LIISKLFLNDFRNYSNYHLEFTKLKPYNFIIGQNGTGKSNLLESIYYSSYLRSFRSYKDNELIKNQTDSFYINLSFEKNSISKDISIKYKTKKEVFINNKKVSKYSAILGELLTVLFSPQDLNIILGQPTYKREYFDLILCLIDSVYLANLRDYNNLLRKKNSLLKNSSDIKMLDVYDFQMASKSEYISTKRHIFIDKFSSLFTDYFKNIGNFNLDTKVLYLPNISKNNNSNFTAENYYNYYLSKRSESIKIGHMCFGIHRDNYLFMLNGAQFNKYGSLGQCRLASLIIKLIQKNIFSEVFNQSPILLVDDVILELDLFRQEHIFNEIFNNEQVFATFTDNRFIKFIKNKENINVINL